MKYCWRARETVVYWLTAFVVVGSALVFVGSVLSFFDDYLLTKKRYSPRFCMFHSCRCLEISRSGLQSPDACGWWTRCRDVSDRCFARGGSAAPIDLSFKREYFARVIVCFSSTPYTSIQISIFKHEQPKLLQPAFRLEYSVPKTGKDSCVKP